MHENRSVNWFSAISFQKCAASGSLLSFFNIFKLNTYINEIICIYYIELQKYMFTKFYTKEYYFFKLFLYIQKLTIVNVRRIVKRSYYCNISIWL